MDSSTAENYIPKSVLIVDDDELILNLVSAQVTAMGAEVVATANNGHDGWTELVRREGGFDLIIMDWKMPGLNGLGLFNRIRGLNERSPQSILVISGFLSRDDFSLLDEYPCTDLLEKPFTKVALESKVKSLFEENTWYQNSSVELDEFVHLIEKSDIKKAFQDLQNLLNKSVRPLPLAILAAKRLRVNQYYKEAARIMEMILEKQPDSLMAIAEYAKVLASMGRFEESRDLLNISLKVSSESVERICLLGEVELNLDEPEEARKHFESALDIDAEHTKAKYGVTIADNLQKHSDNKHGETSLQVNFASVMNIVGVNLVRTGDFAKGIEQYRAALSFLNDNLLIAKLNFNIGLAYFRSGDPAEAIRYLQLAAEYQGTDFPKAHSYLERVKSGVPAAELEKIMAGDASAISYDGSLDDLELEENLISGDQVSAELGSVDDDDPFEEESLVI